MNEVRFIKQNGERWKEFDSYLSKNDNDNPDHLARLYIELTDDLAYSQSFFPRSKTTKYLNQLTLKAHQSIFKRRKSKSSGILQFFKYDYPLVIYKNKTKIIYAFLIFIISALIGGLSVANDQEFARYILGDAYINTTLENIENGNPLGIYESSSQLEMFFTIGWNNIKVSFLAFGLGILFSVGTFYVLFSNGLMLGVFQYFFFTKGLGLLSISGIWLHGTIEIFSIIIAGSAGLILGNSILFPGTYKRVISLQKAAKEGATMILGLIPFFLIADFIESFVTRHYQVSEIFNWSLISASIILIISYFFIYPSIIHKKITNYEFIKQN